MSWFDFAQSIFEAEKNKNSFIVEKLVKISSNDFPTKAVRPKNSQLSSRKFLRPLRTLISGEYLHF